MFKNYLKSALRSLTKNKGFTAINILGLALGLCVCMLIVFYVVDELGYDSYNTNANRIYRVNNDIKFGGSVNNYAVSPAPLAEAFRHDLPEVEDIARFRDRGGYKVRKGDHNIQEAHFVFADPSIFNVFTLPALYGNPVKALAEPKNAVITESMAVKYFATANAVGKTLTLNDTLLYKVGAVIKDVPRRSHFNYDFFLAMSGLDESKNGAWLSNNFNTYVLVKQGTDVNRMAAKFPSMVRKYVGGQLQAAVHMDYDKFEANGDYYHLQLMPLKKIHLYSSDIAELSANGNIQYVYIFSAVAIFILLIACVNFMNLSTARSANRAREVGVRKVLGSSRKQLISQFLSESVIVTFFATLIALAGAWALLPLFNQMADKQLLIDTATMLWLLPSLLVVVLVIGCLAGSYPAFFLSAFQPVQVLKGKLSSGFKGGFLRSFLVVFQFSISVFLIIGTLVIYHQLKYIQSKDLGFNRDQVLVVHNTDILGNNSKVFKQEVRTLPGVISSTMTGFIPTNSWRNSTTFFKDASLNMKEAVTSQVWDIDEDYIPTMGMKMAYGRNFSKDMKTDTAAVIVNEAAARLLGWRDASNKEIVGVQDNMGKVLKRYTIVGVVKDFNFNSLRENISPLLFKLNENRGALAVRIGAADVGSVMKQIKSKWQSVSPNQEFSYSFMDEDFDRTYRTEQRMGGIFIAFTSMAIIIACLGLFGLAAYAAEQRTKEIGIRKVLGASTSIIVGMLSRDFIKLVIISILVASPLAWLFMQQWFLQGFAYHDNVKWWVFAVAGGGAILIAFVTISFQSVKAAIANPVKSLKTE